MEHRGISWVGFHYRLTLRHGEHLHYLRYLTEDELPNRFMDMTSHQTATCQRRTPNSALVVDRLKIRLLMRCGWACFAAMGALLDNMGPCLFGSLKQRLQKGCFPYPVWGSQASSGLSAHACQCLVPHDLLLAFMALHASTEVWMDVNILVCGSLDKLCWNAISWGQKPACASRRRLRVHHACCLHILFCVLLPVCQVGGFLPPFLWNRCSRRSRLRRELLAKVWRFKV